MATASPRAYYAIVARLKDAELQFSSRLPADACDDCEVILTTAAESKAFGSKALELESLSRLPGAVKGQILSHLTSGTEAILVGVDTGVRIGMAVFYGESPLDYATFRSISELCSYVVEYLRMVPAKRVVVRIGNGDRNQASRVANTLVAVQVDRVITVEMVDESGTSIRDSKGRGIRGDERAAAKIAFRKGRAVPERSRTG